jgi:hypothetical protein
MNFYKVLSIFIFALLFTVMNSCEKEQLIPTDQEATTTEMPSLSSKPEDGTVEPPTVKDGILCFKNQASLMAVREKFASFNSNEDYMNWQESIGFKSLAGEVEKAETHLFNHLEKLAQKHTKAELETIITAKGESIVPEKSLQIIKNAGLKIEADKNGSRSIEPKNEVGENTWLLNKDYVYAIGEKLHYFTKEGVYVTDDWNTKDFSQIKDYENLKYRREDINFDLTVANGWKLKSHLYAKRSIYWSNAQNDPWFQAGLYMNPCVYEEKEFMWHTWFKRRHGEKIKHGDGNREYTFHFNYNNWIPEPTTHTTIQIPATSSNPYYIHRAWGRDGIWVWYQYSDMEFNIELVRDGGVEITLEDAGATQKFWNYRHGFYDRDFYDHNPED